LATFTHVDACCTTNGWPVFNLPSGSVRYTTPFTGTNRAWAAGFSPDGDTLYRIELGRMLVSLSSSGAVLDTVPLLSTGGVINDMYVDSHRPYIYVFLEPNLEVIDRRTMTTVTLIPGSPPAGAFRGPARLLLSPIENVLYAVSVPDWKNPKRSMAIYRFRVP
jgi:hypothetical protein